MKFYQGDILNSGADIICHQVNCCGVMGSGLAKQIHERYPVACQAYFDACETTLPDDLMGKAVWSHRSNLKKEYGQPWIVHLFAQRRFGTDQRHTDYQSLRRALTSVRQRLNNKPGLAIAFPYGLGCGLGGGDWGIVQPMIYEIFRRYKGEVQIWKLER